MSGMTDIYAEEEQDDDPDPIDEWADYLIETGRIYQ